jgi:methylenetetrahydrofolate dehydrogenase (NADP+) / methenyltetrahydrofolate cyclohydrolase
MNFISLDGRPVAREMKARALDELGQIAVYDHVRPSIHIVSVGDDPSSKAYESAIIRTASGVGLIVESVNLSSIASQRDVNMTIERLNTRDDVHGIIVLQPLPGHLSRVEVSDRLDPLKDIDGITTFNAGRLFHDDRNVLAPSTPAGGMALLKHYGVEIAGKHAVVVGRSPVVGKPMSLMLLAENATVTMCHSRTTDLQSMTRQADILISAVGKPGTITKDMVRDGATVVDFGVNFVDGTMTGDVDFEEVAQVASAITPVPGGTGRVTTMVLVRNTIKAMRLQVERRDARRTSGLGVSHAKGTS